METAGPELKRQLGPFDSTNIVIGCIIGSGIFIVPSITAALVHSPAMVFLVWVVGGLLTLCGALAYAELGASLPEAGGQYIYLREAYGRLPAFLYGWTLFLVIQTGGMAALAAAFSIYVAYFLPLSTLQARLLSVGCLLLLTIINCLGVRLGATVQNIFTVIKVAGVTAIVVAAFSSRIGSFDHLKPFLSDARPLGLLAAMVGVLWAYEGWHNFSFVAGEALKPGRTIPLALIAGTGLVMILYLAATFAYLYVLPFEAVALSKRVAADSMRAAIGSAGATLISLLILLSVTGAANGMTLSGPRAYYAMARDGLFFQALQRVHPRYGTPALAIIVQGLWASVLALSGRYDQLFTYVIFAAWLFYGMTVAGVIVLRRKHPEWERPYKVWGFPAIPALFVAASAAIVVSTFLTNPRESAWGLAIVFIGVPVYFLWRRALPMQPAGGSSRSFQ